VAEHELIEVLQDTLVHYVPCGPGHFRNVIVWRKRILPALDMGGFGATPGESIARKAAVAAYQSAPGEPLQYGAILLNKYPVGIRVDDSMAQALPANCALMSNCVSSCLEWDDSTVLVIDPARLFATEPRGPTAVTAERVAACVLQGPSSNLGAVFPA